MEHKLREVYQSQIRLLDDLPCRRRSMPSLSLEEYRRYGRQMILPELGKAGQMCLKSASVLIIGAGGLGCPCIAYLAGAGVGRLGIVDGDTIDLSNSHRQILHSPDLVGQLKVESARTFVNELNHNVSVEVYPFRLEASGAIQLFSRYDMILDCSDNQATRYLISDTCVVLGLPLVSGSALKTEGQMAVYNYRGGPCYRCLFPKPTPFSSTQTCAEAGILGPIVGVIGVLQALEAVKLILRAGHIDHNTASNITGYQPNLTLFSPFSEPQWRSIKLRRKKAGCLACGTDASISARTITNGSLDYEAFCGVLVHNFVPLLPEDRVDPRTLKVDLNKYRVIDVRDEVHFGIASLKESINVPMDAIDEYRIDDSDLPVLVVCRQGYDSQVAVRSLRTTHPNLQIQDLLGGLQAFAAVDLTFPLY